MRAGVGRLQVPERLSALEGEVFALKMDFQARLEDLEKVEAELNQMQKGAKDVMYLN